MKYLFVFLIAGLVSTTPLTAQVGKEMKVFRNKEGVTVTLLTPSLYNLYKKESLSRLPDECLKQLKEVNVLHVERQRAAPTLEKEIAHRLDPILENESRYSLVKSRQLPFGSERLYVSQQDEQIDALVLWSENEREIVIIELKGNIRTEKVSTLANTLQVKGLERLTYLLAPETNDENIAHNPFDLDRFVQGFQQRFRSPGDSTRWRGFDDFDSHFENMDAMFNQIEKMFEQFGTFNDNGGIGESISNGLEVIRENGKTRFKVNATNAEIIYLIDGKVVHADSLATLPEDIATVDMVSAPDDPRKSYVIINTLDKAGQFTGFSGGILRFRHGNQDYIFNLDKLPAPVLVINNRPARDLSSIDPVDILQIRPATELESTLLGLPSVKVIIITR
jgi:hypothetical protein